MQENPYTIFFNSLGYSFYSHIYFVFYTVSLFSEKWILALCTKPKKGKTRNNWEMHEKLSNGFGDNEGKIDVDEKINPGGLMPLFLCW